MPRPRDPRLVLLAFLAGLLGPGRAWGDQSPAPPAPSLRNPGFEEQLAGWTEGGWRLGEQRVRFSADPDVHRGGAFSAKLQHLQPNDSYLSQQVAVQPRTLYKISGWLKTDPLEFAEDGRIGANLSILDTRIVSTGVAGGQDWQYRELWVQTSQEATVIAVACRLGYWGSTVRGTAWCDDVAVEAAGEAPPDATTRIFHLNTNAGLFHGQSWGYWGALAVLIAAAVWLGRPMKSSGPSSGTSSRV